MGEKELNTTFTGSLYTRAYISRQVNFEYFK